MLLLRGIVILLLARSLLAVPALVDIRHAPHETYYRVVFDLTERMPVEVERHLDQGFVDVLFHGEMELLAKHFQQPHSSRLLAINLQEVVAERLVYRLQLNEVFEVHAFRQGGGNGFRFIVDCLHRGDEATGTVPVIVTPVKRQAPPRPTPTTPSVAVKPAHDDGEETVATEEILQLLAVAATLEAAGSPETAAHILAEELVNYPEVDTLSFRLGALYLAIGDTTAAYTHLDPLLLKRPYMMVVARMMAELDPKTVGGATSGENADGGYNRGRSGAELSFILVLAGLTALVLLGGGLLVRRKLAERRHLAGFSVGDEDESAAEEKITEPTPVLAPTTEPEETQTAGATIGEENSNYVRDKEVYRLADKKKGTAEIAETLGISQDEVRLILQMRHQEDTPATVMEESLTTEAPEA